MTEYSATCPCPACDDKRTATEFGSPSRLIFAAVCTSPTGEWLLASDYTTPAGLRRVRCECSKWARYYSDNPQLHCSVRLIDEAKLQALMVQS